MRLNFDVYCLEDGTEYVILNNIDEEHREEIWWFVQERGLVFEVNGVQACSPQAIVEYIGGSKIVA